MKQTRRGFLGWLTGLLGALSFAGGARASLPARPELEAPPELEAELEPIWKTPRLPSSGQRRRYPLGLGEREIAPGWTAVITSAVLVNPFQPTRLIVAPLEDGARPGASLMIMNAEIVRRVGPRQTLLEKNVGEGCSVGLFAPLGVTNVVRFNSRALVAMPGDTIQVEVQNRGPEAKTFRGAFIGDVVT